MKIGDTVFQDYAGIHRYGRVKEVKQNLNGQRTHAMKPPKNGKQR